ncbi:MAG: s-methyl-5-thioribose-1-phosphate isomerase [Candidatus Thorarchaeota archaeon]
MGTPNIKSIIKKIGLTYDSDIGIYVHEKTGIPLTVSFDYEDQRLILLDQTKLPYETTIWSTSDWREAALVGIRGMVTRGSQAIGVTAGYAMLLAAIECSKKTDFLSSLEKYATTIRGARPTAAPLSWAVDLTLKYAHKLGEEGEPVDNILGGIREIADYIMSSDLALNCHLREEGKKFLVDGDIIMTHCNGGSLSSTYGGHALGMLEESFVEGLDIKVVAKETRPRCQGYKLTVWELNKAGVPTIIVTDNMITSAIKEYGITKTILGVDRVVRDGSVANKIGSVDIAYLMQNHDIPFYYATSYSTIDLETERGEDIPIEERDKDEITYFYQLDSEYKKNKRIISQNALSEWPTPSSVSVSNYPEAGEVALYNPAFDITPPKLIDLIITDIGVFAPSQIRNLTTDLMKQRVIERLDGWGISSPL